MKVVIVGGVAGGAGTASRLRKNDESAEIILFEKGEYISFANCGLPYYIGGVITEKADLQLLTPQSFAARFNVDVRINSEVISVDVVAKTVTVKNHTDDSEYVESYDKLVLSPGASPIRPALEGMEKNHVFTLRNIPDTYAIHDFVTTHHPRTCAIIGAGFIGLEVAENLTEQGIQVSVIEAMDHVMAPIDLDMAHEVHNYIRAKGIKLHLSQRCKGFTENSVLLENGDSVVADMVILSIGVAPETKFLRDSGISLGARGEILVNEYMETNITDIYALGDAASVKNIVTGKQTIIPLASPANKQARIVGDNLCGKKSSYSGSQGTSIMKLFDMTVACTGEKEENLKRASVAYRKSITTSASHAGYYPGGTTMTVKLLFEPESGRILGSQIVGVSGVDKRIDDIANAIRFGMTVYDLQEMELAYAPPFSSAKDPVNIAGYVGANILEGQMIPFYQEEIDNIPNDAICLDVRTEDEYKGGHIPGFINIPLDNLRKRIGELDVNREIFITCQIGLRGYIAQRILEQNGAKTKNLVGGYRLYDAFEKDRQAVSDGLHQYTHCGMQKD